MPIISIAFYMVIIHIQIARFGNHSKGLNTQSSLAKDNHASPSQHPMNPVQVRIATLTETNEPPPHTPNSKFDLESV
jgi:hypothetical protein